MSQLFQPPLWPLSALEFDAPLPAEILVPDSDTEGDTEVRAAKRRRIQSFGEQYLRGQPLFIQSASLRGPLGNRWKNPWGKRNHKSAVEKANRDQAILDSISKGALYFPNNGPPQKEMRIGRKLLELQRAARAAALQRDGLEESTARPVDLTADEETDIPNPLLSGPALRQRDHHAECGWLRRRERKNPGRNSPLEGINAIEGPSATGDPPTPTRSKQYFKSSPGASIPSPGRFRQFPQTPRASLQNAMPRHGKTAVSPRGQLPDSDIHAMISGEGTQTPFGVPLSLLSARAEGSDNGPSSRSSRRKSARTEMSAHLQRRGHGSSRQHSQPSIDVNRAPELDGKHGSSPREMDFNEGVRPAPSTQAASVSPEAPPTAKAVDQNRGDAAADSRPLTRKHPNGFTPVDFRLSSCDRPRRQGPIRREEAALHEQLGAGIAPDDGQDVPSNISPLTDIDSFIREGQQSAKRLAQNAIARLTEMDKSYSHIPSGETGTARGSAARCTLTAKPSKKKRRERGGKRREKEMILPRPPPEHQPGANGVTDPAGTVVSEKPKKHPLNASPGLTSSPGFAYRKPNATEEQSNPSNDATLDALRSSKSVDGGRKARLMALEPPPVSHETHADKADGDNSIPKSSQDDWNLVQQYTNQIIPACKSGADPEQSIGSRIRKVLRRSGAIFESASNTASNHALSIPDVAGRQPQPSLDHGQEFSTQKAILCAQAAFQDEIASPAREPPVQSGASHGPQGNGDGIGAITPFRSFNLIAEGVGGPLESEMFCSTQDIFNDASPFAPSTAKTTKGKKRASFAPSPTKTVAQHGRQRPEVPNDAALPTDKAKVAPDRPAPPRSARPASAGEQRSVPGRAEMGSGGASLTPRPSKAHEGSFSITPDGSLRQASRQERQRALDDVEIEAVLDDAGSFLRSWDLESELKKSGRWDGLIRPALSIKGS